MVVTTDIALCQPDIHLTLVDSKSTFRQEGPVMKPNRRSYVNSLCKTQLRIESLEQRRLLAADLLVFQNPVEPLDVNLDQFVSPVDALAIINQLNSPQTQQQTVGALLDSSGDHILAPNDALSIINGLNNSTSKPTQVEGLYTARDYFVEQFEALPTEARIVVDQFTEIINNHESTTEAIYDSLRNFSQYSIANANELDAFYGQLHSATLLNDDNLQREVHAIGDEIHDVSVASFGNSPSSDSSDGEIPYEFDPADYEDPAAALPDLFDELDEGIDDIELPTYGDVIDNYDEIYQTYEESEYEIGEYVDEMINVNDYEDFVLNGGNLSDLFQDIEERAEEGITTIEDVVAPYGPDIELGDLINDAFNSAYVGELIYNDISAIGGETTGSVIVLNQGGIVEVDFGRADYLHDRASELNNQTVVIEGHLEMVEGIEIPNRTIVQARTIFGTPELESLQLALETIDLSSSLAIAEALEENGLT